MIQVVSHYKTRKHSYEPNVVEVTSWWKHYSRIKFFPKDEMALKSMICQIESEWNCKVITQPFTWAHDRYVINLTDEQAVLFLIKFPNSCEYKLTSGV